MYLSRPHFLEDRPFRGLCQALQNVLDKVHTSSRKALVLFQLNRSLCWLQKLTHSPLARDGPASARS
jgi:hypothetical protein